jgi:hypothetical protein
MYPVEKMCKSMRVSKNAHYHWSKNKDIVVLKTARAVLKERIKIILSKVEKFMVALGFKKC